MFKLNLGNFLLIGLWCMHPVSVQAWEEYIYPAEQFSRAYFESSYSDVTEHCGNVFMMIDPVEYRMVVVETDPLYTCSGLIVRGTRQELPDGQNAWDPYPEGRTSDTSFSYIRADIKMNRLAWSYTNGFILDAGSALKVNCFYPLDAESDLRGDNGCGAHEKAPKANPQCTDDVVLSDSIPAWSRCRYDLRTRSAPLAFRKAVEVAKKASLVSELPNDLKIETWKKGCDERLDIHAFFYVNEQGKAFAIRDRDKYKEVCGHDTRLVYMKFPEKKDGLIKFEVIE